MTALVRILILSNGPLCRNPRVYKEARSLGAVGYAVTVLTVRDHASSELQDRLLMTGVPFRRVSVDMLPGCGSSALDVLFRRSLLWVARKAAHLPRLRSIHSLGPAWSLLRRARREPADLIIAHNEIAHWAGTKLLEEGRVVAADFEDWHSEDLLPAARQNRPLALLRRMERTLLQQAVYTTTTSHALAEALDARYGGRRPQVLTNSFPLQSNFRRGVSAELPAFFWFSQTLGAGRGLEPFVAAWIRMRQPSRLVLLGESAGDFAQQLRTLVPPALHSRLELLGLVPASELPDVIARHDIGLALELKEIPNRDLTITNKILQYLNAGLAVVATDTRGQREVFAHAPDAGLFITFDDPVALAERLDELVADRTLLAARQLAARQLAETRYCWELEAPKLLALVSTALTQAKLAKQ